MLILFLSEFRHPQKNYLYGKLDIFFIDWVFHSSLRSTDCRTVTVQTLSKEGGGAVRRQISTCVEKLLRNVHTQTLEETADQIQDLYTAIHNMVTTHQAFAGNTQDLCTAIHSKR